LSKSYVKKSLKKTTQHQRFVASQWIPQGDGETIHETKIDRQSVARKTRDLEVKAIQYLSYLEWVM